MGPKNIRSTYTSTKLEKKLIFCLLFFLLTTTAEATEYIVSPFPSDQSGASINGEEVIELKDFTIYWQFLLWLAAVNILSATDMLLYPVKLIFPILGFQSTDHINVLDNLKRYSIYTHIKSRPGAYLSEITKKMSLNKGTVQYHLQILETHNKIEVYREFGKTRYFQNNSTFGEEEKKVISALQNTTNQRIISEIRNGRCNTNATLACEIGVSRATISWYVRNLKETGLINETKKGKNIIYSINPSYQNLVEKYG